MLSFLTVLQRFTLQKQTQAKNMFWTVGNVLFSLATIFHPPVAVLQDRENPLDNVLLYSLRRAGSVEMLEHSGDEEDRRTSRKSGSPPAPLSRPPAAAAKWHH